MRFVRLAPRKWIRLANQSDFNFSPSSEKGMRAVFHSSWWWWIFLSAKNYSKLPSQWAPETKRRKAQKSERDENPIYFSGRRWWKDSPSSEEMMSQNSQIYIQSNRKCPEIYLSMSIRRQEIGEGHWAWDEEIFGKDDFWRWKCKIWRFRGERSLKFSMIF